MVRQQQIGVFDFGLFPKAEKDAHVDLRKGKDKLQTDGWQVVVLYIKCNTEERKRWKMMSDCVEKERKSLPWGDGGGKKECVLLISDGSSWSPPGVLYRGHTAA